MKKIIFALLICITLIFSVTAFAEDRQVSIIIDGQPLVSDVAPQLVNSRTMLPMRAIFEALGAEVNWLGDDEIIIATRGETMITLKIGQPIMSIQKISDNKNNVIELDVAPYLHSSRTMVPVRAIAEALDAKVEWIDETWTVVITQK